ncbi:hypothetical protein [Psychrobacillus sp. NPDC096623]|uniref:hypothetical protein n=1 Tax=Psychrobacillus sp. NPDC096623 TaxID=3364492 RepID=UPI00381DA72A
MKLSNRLKVEYEETEISSILINNLSMYTDQTFSLKKWSNSSNINKEALERIYNLLCTIDEFKIILDKYNADFETITDIYWLVMASGAGQEIKGNYLPISMFLNEHTLEWVLKNINSVTTHDLALFLVNYFSKHPKKKSSSPLLKIGIGLNISNLVFYFGVIVIHFYTAFLFHQHFGLWQMFVAFFLPIISELFLFFNLIIKDGIFNFYAVLFYLLIVNLVINSLLLKISLKASSNDSSFQKQIYK